MDEVLYTTKAGREIRGVKLQSIVALARARIEGLKKGLNTRALNASIMMALEAGGQYWIRAFLPKRFEDSYARRILGYKADAGYEESKRKEIGHPGKAGRGIVVAPQPTPFVYTGESRNSTLTSARVDSSVMANGKCRLVVKFQWANISFIPQAMNFTRLPSHEYARVMQVILKELENTVVPAVVSGTIGPGFTKTKMRDIAAGTERSIPGVQARKV